MGRIHLKRLGVSLAEVSTCLASEHRLPLRRRLRAVQMVLKGATVGRAAKAAKVGKAAIERWLRVVRAAGCSGLLAIDPPGIRMAADHAKMVREQIRAAWDHKLNWRARRRLAAIDTVLAGKSVQMASAVASVVPDTVRDWIAIVRREGLAPILREDDGRNRQVNKTLSVAARALAATERDQRVATRLLAIANVADGMSVADAAIRARASEKSVRDWTLEFNAGGVEALRDPPNTGRPVKLRPEQLDRLKEIARSRPKTSYVELCRIVQKRFGVSYREAGMRRLLSSLGLGCSRTKAGRPSVAAQ